jgi:hypothetical protein
MPKFCIDNVLLHILGEVVFIFLGCFMVLSPCTHDTYL